MIPIILYDKLNERLLITNTNCKKQSSVLEKIRVAQPFNVLPGFYEPKGSVRHKFGYSEVV